MDCPNCAKLQRELGQAEDLWEMAVGHVPKPRRQGG